MTQTNSESDTNAVQTALMQMCPEGMREMFAPMVGMAIAQMPADALSSLATDLQSVQLESGDPDLEKLIALGKKFGLTDEMIQGYRESFAASGVMYVDETYVAPVTGA